MQSAFTQFRRQHSRKRKYNAPVSIVNSSQVLNAEKYVQNFLQLIKQGSAFICVVCNRCLHKSNVVSFVSEKYSSEISHDVNTDVRSFDENRYICRTCNTKLTKNNVPCQAVYNSLETDDMPDVNVCSNRLELLLIYKRFLFKKINVMVKGQYPKLHGAVINVPVKADKTYNFYQTLKTPFLSSSRKNCILKEMCILSQYQDKKYVMH